MDKNTATVGLPDLDDIDRGIIDALRDDIHRSNKSIAQALNVSESTITTRLRAMSDNGWMRVLAEADLRAFGHEFVTFLGIKVSGAPIDDVARAIAALDTVVSVVSTVGRFDLIVNALAANAAEHAVLVEQDLAAIDGIASVETGLVTEHVLQKLDYAALEHDR